MLPQQQVDHARLQSTALYASAAAALKPCQKKHDLALKLRTCLPADGRRNQKSWNAIHRSCSALHSCRTRRLTKVKAHTHTADSHMPIHSSCQPPEPCNRGLSQKENKLKQMQFGEIEVWTLSGLQLCSIYRYLSTALRQNARP